MNPALNNVSEETRDELAALALQLSGNTKTRKSFLGLVKEAAPNTPIPELDAEKRIEEATSALREENNKLKNSFEEFKLGGQMKEMKDQVRSKYSLSDDDFKKMEEKMGKKELPVDYEFAARLYKQETEVATPTSYGTSGYGPFNLEKNAKAFEGLMENETGWANETAHQIIDEMQKAGKAPAF